MGGYDEEMFGWGFEDDDLAERHRAAGGSVLERKLDRPHFQIGQPCSPAKFQWYAPSFRGERVRENRARSAANIAAGRLIANPGGFGRATVYADNDDARATVLA